MVLFELALLLDDKGDHARAQPLHRQALAIVEKKAPDEKRAIASMKVGLGRNLLREGATGAAEPLLVDGLAVLEKAAFKPKP